MANRHNRREFLATTAALAGMLGARRASAAAARRPNVIVIVADDMGWADAGFNGCKDIPTPGLDRLAQHGVRFQCGYVSHPFCSPTRAGLVTGRYQQRFGHENNPTFLPKDERVGLPLGEITLPDVLKKAGYVTGMVGKWHLGAAPLFHPMKRGFDEFFGFPGGGHDYFKADTQTDTKEYLVPIQRNGKPVAENEYLTDALSREAVGFVRRHREERFFLYLTYNAPHTPQQAPDKYIERFAAIEDQRRRLYAAMLSALDDGVGHLLDTLRDLNLENDTLVFFFSDNGGPVAVNGSSNGPLRGAKGAVYEGGVRVPFAVQWRGRLPEGKTLQHPVICLDIFPTAVPAGGAQLPADRKIDGVNLLPYMTGQTDAPPHERLFWRTGGGDFFAVREGRFKLVKSRDGQPELYDLDADIGETNDLAAKQPDVVKRLLAACEQWNSELAPPLWPNPAPAKRAAAKRKN